MYQHRQQTIYDLNDDFDELLFLYRDVASKLKHFNHQIDAVRSEVPLVTLEIIGQYSNLYALQVGKSIKNIILLQRKLPYIKTDSDTIHFLEKKNYLYDKLRIYNAFISSLIVSCDWQSPSFTHSIYSQAGKQTGKIHFALNDYKRDHHIDEKGYERSFIKEYIDAPIKFPIVSYLTASGMAAFSTILYFLMSVGKLKGAVVVGKSIYFQNKILLESIAGIIIHTVDESKTEDILQCLHITKPNVLILDSLSNTKDVFLPDLHSLVRFLGKDIKKDIYVVIDNTCLPAVFQPFSEILVKSRKLHLFMFESLLKYHQFGMDRVNAGIIYGYGKDSSKLFLCRRDLGTNIADSSVYCLPVPSRKRLERRLSRFSRNARMLSLALQDCLPTPKKYIEKVNYPILTHHSCSNWAKKLSFAGSFFTLQFKNINKTVSLSKRFISLSMQYAKKRKIDLIGGSSFGFNTTRIYLIGTRTTLTQPFLRISAGTETMYEIEKLIDIFNNAIRLL